MDASLTAAVKQDPLVRRPSGGATFVWQVCAERADGVLKSAGQGQPARRDRMIGRPLAVVDDYAARKYLKIRNVQRGIRAGRSFLRPQCAHEFEARLMQAIVACDHGHSTGRWPPATILPAGEQKLSWQGLTYTLSLSASGL